ncbi:FxsB family cyclophane-forming radical SAM/SPASM peptide maturase [Streptomyces phaeochromogenes]|uniref:FxsB family cyclophane-forming radical SAM/SPASM peptide maturase n=1 Tax=Streptomyces phaeochromogenes TaxID=1923 RepID=UPI002E115959|nr:FxsB family cyclophane-forming radical SAM/SPASM peptide maturase [Streptomyces phaeochromogenes]WSJ09580.1 FxsB family radical SAM/SPASM domain protein [Streptomyces phaeochromogenes]
MTATPFRQFVLKVHSRCNLACDYCYVYEMADQSWRDQPHRMSAATADHVVERIAEHAQAHRLPSVTVVLHGGEPMLAGVDFLTDLVRRLRAEAEARVDVRLQTNGVLLTQRRLETLAEAGVRIGVSLDGDASANDRHRRFADGRGSHGQVHRALRLLGQDRYREVFGGLLCAVDLAHPPLATYEALLAYEPPAVDFLLPHGTWSDPPPGRGAGSAGTPYADWLLPIFDRWYERHETWIRLFGEVIQSLLGGVPAVEGLGLRPSTMVVVDTDGSIKQLDALSAAYPGAADLGLNVSSDPFDAALSHPITVLRQGGIESLGATCHACTLVQHCGGGLLAHRFHRDTGFHNPSVFCPDLLRLITVIGERVTADLNTQ